MALVSGSTIVFEDGVIMPIRFAATIAPPGRQRTAYRRQEGRMALTITRTRTFIVDGGFRPWTFVKIETSDDGVVGWGDCTDWGSPGPVTAMVARLSEFIVGQDPMQAERIWWELYAASIRHTGGIAFKAMAGIDSALW